MRHSGLEIAGGNLYYCGQFFCQYGEKLRPTAADEFRGLVESISSIQDPVEPFNCISDVRVREAEENWMAASDASEDE